MVGCYYGEAKQCVASTDCPAGSNCSDGVCDPMLPGDPDCDNCYPGDPNCPDGQCDPMNPVDPDCGLACMVDNDCPMGHVCIDGGCTCDPDDPWCNPGCQPGDPNCPDNVCDPTGGFQYDQNTIDNFGKVNLKRGRRVIEFVLKYYF